MNAKLIEFRARQRPSDADIERATRAAEAAFRRFRQAHPGAHRLFTIERAAVRRPFRRMP